ncbi:DUF1206 domain-containing protein [Streptomyces sp. BE303]|uniref:DUF1206 domain-containing protein n=1 Tax=Streptomyces sp. BE303 TaxID=3002528 RepID=UPI002E7A715A|nr:DUF1206 domain-containing protein [Streptomyces sp. BE303]MED7948990.1 DUF1206 domain-containing protein [Streptomyces sp. BE303]
MSTATQTRQHRGDSADRLLRLAGRGGFTARGLVYVVVGYLALRIALLGGGSEEADRQGALRQIADQPFGRTLLWLLAVGFGCMTIWRASAAAFGERGRKKTTSRLLNTGRAAFYASVCWGTAAFAAGSGGGSDSDSASKDWTATVLGRTGGRFLVSAAGLVLIGVGVGIAARAALRKFLRKMDTAAMGRRTRAAVTAGGIAGNVARGVVFVGVGVHTLIAAVRFDPAQAKGVDDTLRSFAATPVGPWLLAVLALGLLLFGVFSLASVRWRRF